MRVIFGFVIGAVAGFFAAHWMSDRFDTGMDHLGIIVRVQNDTPHLYSTVVLQVSDGRKFTCTLQKQACSFFVEAEGDVGFSVSAEDHTGAIYNHAMAHEYYGEPGTFHTVPLSTLSASNT